MNPNTSYFAGKMDHQLEETTYPKHFHSVVEANPNKIAYIYQSTQPPFSVELTYAELEEKVNRVIQGLESLNIKQKSVVVVYLPNCLEYVYAQLAALCGGFIIMPFNPLYTRDQLERLLPRISPSVIITCPQLLPRIPEVCPRVITGKVTDVIDSKYTEKFPVKRIEEFFSNPSTENYIVRASKTVSPYDDSLYACTSGSTGEPKICVYTHFGMINPFITMDHSYNVPLEIRCPIMFMPLFTTAAHFQIDAVFAVGARVVVLDKYNPVAIINAVKKYKVTNVNGAPSGILALINHPEFKSEDFETVKHVTMGGAVVSDSLIEATTKAMNLETCRSGYGMTETCGMMFFMSMAKGNAGPHYELRIVDHNTREIVKFGFSGEIEVKSKMMMKGYLNNPEANKQVFTDDGWFKTGDEGSADANGKLYITGRVKEMIIRGGHNVWPEEIIDVLQTHPGVIQAGCVSVPDRSQGELIVAMVMVKDPAQTTSKELKVYCQNRLVSFAVPTHIFIIDQLPLTSFGKVYNPTLRSEALKKINEYWEELSKNNTSLPTTPFGKQLAALWAQWFNIPQSAISTFTDFYDLGGDSLVGSQTIGLIKKYVNNAPFDLLTKCPTLGQLEQYVIYSVLVKDVEDIKNLEVPEFKGLQSKNPNNVCFLTGSNGFLGIHLLQALLKKGYHVICLVRSLNPTDGLQRISQAASTAKLELNYDEIEIVCGDVSQDHCGLADIYSKIIGRISLIIHNAAQVNWSRSYSTLRVSNYIGTKNVAQIAFDSGSELIFVSSIGVSKANNGKECIPSIDVLPHEENGYIQSKWMSELYLQKLRNSNYKIGIIRPAFQILMTSFGKFARMLCNNGLAPTTLPMILTPVDLVADAFVKLVGVFPTCNLLPLKHTDVKDICDLIAKLTNRSLEHLPMPEIKNKLAELAKQGNTEVLSLLPSLQSGGFVNYEYDFVKNLGIDCSETDSSVSRTVHNLLDSGFFGEEYQKQNIQVFKRSAV
ncbi:4-coumarate--CoA ligase [Entamoeba marina]